LKKLASAIVTRPATVAILLTTDVPALIVVARSQDVALDAGVVLKHLIDRFGGKGGGKGALAQGGGLTGDVKEMLSAVRECISGAL
jgi:alanyl-tRNA synthetase